MQIFEWYFDTDTPTEQQQSIIDFMSIVRDEDVPIVQSVQRGLHSMGYRQGRFIVDGDRGVSARFPGPGDPGARRQALMPNYQRPPAASVMSSMVRPRAPSLHKNAIRAAISAGSMARFCG